MSTDPFHDLAVAVQGEEALVAIFTLSLAVLDEDDRTRCLDAVRVALPTWQSQVANTLRLTVTEDEARECLAFIQREKPAGIGKIETMIRAMAGLSESYFGKVLEEALK